MVMDWSVGFVTASVMLFELMLFSEAEILVLPTESAVARPLALIVAVAVFEEFHATCKVMLAVEPSL